MAKYRFSRKGLALIATAPLATALATSAWITHGFFSSPEGQSVEGLGTALIQAINDQEDEIAARQVQTLFVQSTCEKIDDILTEAFQNAGTTHSFTTSYNPPVNFNGSCTVSFNNEPLFKFYNSQDFIDGAARGSSLSTLLDAATDGMTAEQLDRLRQSVNTTIEQLLP